MTLELLTTRDYEARISTADRAYDPLHRIQLKETKQMLLYEELSKARIHALEAEVRAHRRAGATRARRRWNRVARWATHRAARYPERY